MIKVIEEFIRKENLISMGDTIIVGLSGGADSICLLDVLYRLRIDLDFSIVVVHVHHGLRGEDADQDVEFVREVCKKYSVEYEIVYCNVLEESKCLKISEEEAGRLVRYKAFKNTMSKYPQSKIATAHHKNDQAETILFNLFRGTGMKGLIGMKSIRDKIIRPLLCIGREQIEEYTNINSLEFREDYTNFQEIYTRNKLRLKLIPYIQDEINEKVVDHVCQMGNILKEEEEFLDLYTNGVYNKVVSVQNNKYVVDSNAFFNLHKAVKKRVIRKILLNITEYLKDVQYTHIEKIIQLFDRQVGKNLEIPGGILVKKNYNSVEFSKKINENKQVNEAKITNIILIDKFEEVNKDKFLQVNRFNTIRFCIINNIKDTIIPKNIYTKWFDYDKIKTALSIRNRKQGDYIRLKGIKGRKKLKDFFVDNKIPREERDNIPLLVDGSEVIWIIGYRINENYKVSEMTEKILEVELLDRRK